MYFWDNEQSELKLMHSENMYPPRFTLQVHGENATHDAVALVEFGGACMDLSTEIYLSLPTRGTQDAHCICILYSYLTVTPTKTFSDL